MMRKVSVFITAMLVSFSAFAQTNVTSVNVVGFNKVAIPPNAWVMATINFESFGDSTLQDLVGDQLPVGSVAYIWDRVNQQYIADSRTLFGGWASTNIIMRGDGFWLKNNGSTTNYVSFNGEVPAAINGGDSTTIAGLTGFNIVGYAYPTDSVWTNTTLATAAAVGDVLYTWDIDNQTYNVFSKSLFGGWSTPADYTISAGAAFWIKTSASIDWTEVAPYNL